MTKFNLQNIFCSIPHHNILKNTKEYQKSHTIVIQKCNKNIPIPTQLDFLTFIIIIEEYLKQHLYTNNLIKIHNNNPSSFNNYYNIEAFLFSIARLDNIKFLNEYNHETIYISEYFYKTKNDEIYIKLSKELTNLIKYNNELYQYKSIFNLDLIKFLLNLKKGYKNYSLFIYIYVYIHLTSIYIEEPIRIDIIATQFYTNFPVFDIANRFKTSVTATYYIKLVCKYTYLLHLICKKLPVNIKDNYLIIYPIKSNYPSTFDNVYLENNGYNNLKKQCLKCYENLKRETNLLHLEV